MTRVSDLQPRRSGAPRQRTRNGIRLFVVAGCLTLAALAPAAAQPRAGEGGEDVAPGRLREAMRTYFENRLRRELALSDEQMARIEPQIRELEQARATSRAEKAEAVRKLTRGLEGGAADAELQDGLDTLERLDDEQRRAERRVLHAIDQSLSARQRVQLRFFLLRFQRDLAERVRELRGAGGAERRRRPGARR